MEKHTDMQNVAWGISRYATMVKTCLFLLASLLRMQYDEIL